MQKKWRIYTVVIVLLIAGLACNVPIPTIQAFVDKWFDLFGISVDPSPEWEDTRTEEEFLEDQGEELPVSTEAPPVEVSLPSECNAQDSLLVVVSQPVINDDDYENRCKYTVTYSNTGDQRIWVFVHKTHKGLNDILTEDEWRNYYALDPGEELEMRYQTLIYKNSGKNSIEVVTDVAPIFATEGCKNTFRNDVEPRIQISYPIFVPCD